MHLRLAQSFGLGLYEVLEVGDSSPWVDGPKVSKYLRKRQHLINLAIFAASYLRIRCCLYFI